MRDIWKKRALSWALGGSLLSSLVGCAGGPVGLEGELAEARDEAGLEENMPFEQALEADALEEAGEATASLLERLELEDGRVVEFLEEADGSIGVVEIDGAGAPLVPRLVAEHQATTLEIFQALAPLAEAPEAIRAAHSLEAEALERELDVRPLVVADTLGFDDPGQEDYYRCDWMFSTPAHAYDHAWVFNNAWHQTFKSRTDVEESMFLDEGDIESWSNFYAGGQGVRRVYLGVCVGNLWANSYNSGSDEVDFRVQRLSNGSWSTVRSYRLNDDQRAVYYNGRANGFRYRGRIRAYDPPGASYTDGIRDVGFGVAYDKQLQLIFRSL